MLPCLWRCVVESAGSEVGLMTMLGHKEVEKNLKLENNIETWKFQI
jgi:hypothetical protein